MHQSGTQSVLHPRSYSTFGTILPPIIEQVLCPRSPLLFTFFITFISFHNLMFERFIIQCILYDTSHKSLEHTTLIYIISGFKLSFLHTILFYIRRLLICNCTHSSILPALHPSYFRSFLSYFPHPIRSTSSVVFYRRYDLTADYRTSPVPAISTFIYIFITFHFIP